MTRHELAPYEGRIVGYTGYIEKWCNHSNGVRDMLLTNVQIRLYDNDENGEVRNAHKGIKTQHVWVRRHPDKEHEFKFERLELAVGYGRVVWYRRADRSVDLGIRPLPSILGDDLSDSIRRYISSGCWEAAEKFFIDLQRKLEKGFVVIHCSNCSSNEIMADIKDIYLPLVRKNLAVAATARRAGKCRAPKSFAELLT